jgi:ankyrin repeat protein
VRAEHTIQDFPGTIKFLIQEAGADIDAEKIGTTNPLQNAVLTRHVEAAKLLLAAGASPNPVDTTTGRKRLLLADALRPGHNQEVVKLMLDAGAEADVDEDPYEGRIEHLPIMNLTLRGSNPRYAREEAQVAHMVCERAKNINVVVDGHPALWHYVRAGRQDIGQVLIEHGADPQKANVEVRDTVLPLVALDTPSAPQDDGETLDG